MAKALTSDDVLPLAACLPPRKRVRLLRLTASPPGAGSPFHRTAPPAHGESSTDAELLEWDAEGWDDAGCGAAGSRSRA